MFIMSETIANTCFGILGVIGFCYYCVWLGKKDKEREKRIKRLNREDLILHELTACEDDEDMDTKSLSNLLYHEHNERITNQWLLYLLLSQH